MCYVWYLVTFACVGYIRSECVCVGTLIIEPGFGWSVPQSAAIVIALPLRTGSIVGTRVSTESRLVKIIYSLHGVRVCVSDCECCAIFDQFPKRTDIHYQTSLTDYSPLAFFVIVR